MIQRFGLMSRSHEPDNKASCARRTCDLNTDWPRFLRSGLHITDGMELGIFSAPVSL
jgi:hypothetical protein